jgi:hypothetical protein
VTHFVKPVKLLAQIVYLVMKPNLEKIHLYVNALLGTLKIIPLNVRNVPILVKLVSSLDLV